MGNKNVPNGSLSLTGTPINFIDVAEDTLCIFADSGGVKSCRFFGLDFSSLLSKTVGNFSWHVEDDVKSLVTGSPIIIPMSSESTEADLLFKGSIPSSEQLALLSSSSDAEPDWRLWSSETDWGFENRTRLTGLEAEWLVPAKKKVKLQNEKKIRIGMATI